MFTGIAEGRRAPEPLRAVRSWLHRWLLLFSGRGVRREEVGGVEGGDYIARMPYLRVAVTNATPSILMSKKSEYVSFRKMERTTEDEPILQ